MSPRRIARPGAGGLLRAGPASPSPGRSGVLSSAAPLPLLGADPHHSRHSEQQLPSTGGARSGCYPGPAQVDTAMRSMALASSMWGRTRFTRQRPPPPWPGLRRMFAIAGRAAAGSSSHHARPRETPRVTTQHRSFDPVPAKPVGPGRPSPQACLRQLADGLGAEPPHQIRPVACVLVGRLQIREPDELQIDLSSLSSDRVNPVGAVVLFLGDLHRPSAWRDWGIEKPQLERRAAEFQPTSPIGHLAHAHRRSRGPGPDGTGHLSGGGPHGDHVSAVHSGQPRSPAGHLRPWIRGLACSCDPQVGRRAMWSRSVPGTPFSSTGPISVNVTGPPSAAATASWLTSTSPGLAYSAILAARLTVRPK
jgi:hypothetical protein